MTAALNAIERAVRSRFGSGFTDYYRWCVAHALARPAVPSPPAATRPKCTCETFGNGVISGNDGRLPPPEGCPRHGGTT